MRKWVNENSDNDSSVIFRNLFDNILEYVDPASVPVFIMLLSEYQYKAAFVANPEINMAAFLTEVMASCDIK
jgi:hypothetical protein